MSLVRGRWSRRPKKKRRLTILEGAGAKGPELRSGAMKLWKYKGPETMLAGPAETGKTFACLYKLDGLLWKYPGAQAVLCRKVRRSIAPSVLQTYVRKILPMGSPVLTYGGESPEFFDYPNGSRLWIAGLDDARQSLSSERDFIYCFVGETKVESPTPVVKAFKRRYSWPLVTIRTAAGNELTGTPNHPILTDQGWIPLGSLAVGGYVVSRRFGKESASVDPHIEDAPSSIAEVFSSLAGSAGIVERLSGVDMDFHGDGGQSDVDVVSASGLLQDAVNAPSLQPSVQQEIGRAGLDFLNLESLCSGSQIPFAARLASRSAGGRQLESLDPLRVSLSPVVGRIASSERLQSAAQKLCFDDAIADANAGSNRDHSTFPVKVSLDRIIHVSIADLDPSSVIHVYNLHTVGNYFIANNVVVHNCNQAEELTEGDWQTLTTRATGRAGNAPYAQIFGDCNPDSPTHWIKRRERLKVFDSRHEDNPSLWDGAAWTAQGIKTLETLDALTGLLYQRLRLGKWTGAEGQVYEGWDKNVHVVDWFKVPWSWVRYWSVDFGYTNPFVCLFWAADGDGRLFLYREIYMTGRLVEDHARRMLKLCGALQEGGGVDWSMATEPRPKYIYCDHDAEDRATLERHLRMTTTAAAKSISPGIQAVASRLKLAKDGRPRLALMRGCLDERDSHLVAKKLPTCLAEEMESYVWDTGSNRRKGEQPVDKDNHGEDSLRYQVYSLDGKPQIVYRESPADYDSDEHELK